jgi:hypothetical protein
VLRKASWLQPHIALTTHDIDHVASFYKVIFDMEEVGRNGSTHIYLRDGDLNYPGNLPSSRGALGPSNAEVKLRGPDGVIIDISECGWVGNST